MGVSATQHRAVTGCFAAQLGVFRYQNLSGFTKKGQNGKRNQAREGSLILLSGDKGFCSCWQSL